MKENNNNNEKKYDINQDYIMRMLLSELIIVIICGFWYCVVEKNWEYGHYASISTLILSTILSLSSHYPYIVRQLKDKKDNNDIK